MNDFTVLHYDLRETLPEILYLFWDTEQVRFSKKLQEGSAGEDVQKQIKYFPLSELLLP